MPPEDAFITAALACQAMLLRVATNLTHNRDDADDLVQETFLRAHVKRHLYQEGTNLGAWLRTMLLHLYYDNGRIKQRRNEIPLDDVLLPHSVGRRSQRDRATPGIIGNVEDEAIAHIEVAQALADAGPLLRMMVKDDLSYEEAARRLGVKVVTMNGRVYRARQEVRERRKQREDGGA